MGNKIIFKITIFILITLFGLFAWTFLTAQESVSKSGNAEKIKGTRFIAYPDYSGTPYLSDKFLIGEIEFLNGTKIGNIGLRYSTYRDELIYYNTVLQAQIVVDKISLKGFSFIDENGKNRIFRHQYYDGFLHEERYFEVLCDGKISLLVYRKVDLESCDPSYNKLGLAYQQVYKYYLYAAGKGFFPININRNSLLLKFDKPSQKLVKKILRKNNIVITDEISFVKAWNLIIDKGIDIHL